VRSLASAKAFLVSKGLLGTASADELTLALDATDGLVFKLREANSAN